MTQQTQPQTPERLTFAGPLPAGSTQLVLDFINERPNYVRALRASVVADADYHRWQGGAEARRQLAQQLGLTVPHELGQTTEPAVATAQILRTNGGQP